MKNRSDVDYITIIPLDGTEAVEARDAAILARVVPCFEQKRREPVKFMLEYKLQIHYANGQIAEAAIGGKYAKGMDGVSYELNCDMAKIFREVIAQKRPH
jgi:hypothetical protein